MAKKTFVLFALIISFAYLACAEEITISTYYPAPYGVYREMRVTRSVTFDSEVQSVDDLSGEKEDGMMVYEKKTTEPQSRKFYYYDETANNGAGAWKEFGAAGWYVPSEVKVTNASHDGDFYSAFPGNDGYQAMREWIDIRGCPISQGYHVCDAVELTRYAQINGFINLSGWYNSGCVSHTPVSKIVGDCNGWCTNTTDYYGLYLDPSSGHTRFLYSECNQYRPVLCCR